jgi:hypothetical protein
MTAKTNTQKQQELRDRRTASDSRAMSDFANLMRRADALRHKKYC